MEQVLVLIHTEAGGTLARPALEAITVAKELGAGFAVGIAGEAVQNAANQVAASGATRFFGVEGAEFAQARYSSDAAAAEALCRASGATLVIAPQTSRWARVLPGMAVRLNGRADTHATAVGMENGSPAISRWYYRQRMEASLTRSQRPWIVLVDAGCANAWSGEPGAAAVEVVTPSLPEIRTTVTGVRAPLADQQTIRPDAGLLFVAGAGWTKNQADGKSHLAEAEQLILGFLERTKASLGSSKSLVDLSGEGQAVLPFMSHLNQIGQTGSTPRHPKGLSTCCHGEEPHVVGWRFINERRAINKDPNCGWARGKADVLYVADAFEVVAKVNALLDERKP